MIRRTDFDIMRCKRDRHYPCTRNGPHDVADQYAAYEKR